ncbi:MAG: arsenate reductase [Hydrogenophaga sp.]|jgi:Spx/MgsR family transcriptional regulator|uniref:arsenate reductase n=1 Tax=Hydrogenophaga sp. TaxID=1904254 RepID=UPI000ECA5755|nr:arsenate reductase [Hydrogenophaga sp.]MDD3784181.1 arsenate reductase [Hydrogenophaga sp.]MDX9968156.1 arsenate reductase [Hydrogenophaga sp.]HAJ14002.1 arsenate reductase [Comamonadaceae bacterium]
MITLYGIPNCDTVKKARTWLDSHGLAYRFHDFKKAGVPPERLEHWLAALGWEVVINRRGTTWRALDAATKAGVTDAAGAHALALAHASLIKRPVVEWDAAHGGGVTAGFDAAAWAGRL